MITETAADPVHRTAPIIETERLVLRPHRRTDFADCAAMWADPVVTRHIGGRPFSKEEVWARLLRYVGHWTLLGFGYWAITEKDGARFIGELGFADFQREITPSLEGIPELGWALIPAAHGKGYATEALRTAIAWGDGVLNAEETACIINPGNLASIRVATKCGYRETLSTHYKDQPTLLFKRPGGGR